MTSFPKHFIDALRTKECILFIGSGISTWSGLPDWEGLLKLMVQFLRDRGLEPAQDSEICEIISRRDLLTAASLCASLMRNEYRRDFFHEVIVKPNPKPHEIHRIIVDLGPDSFISTNYDHLMDDAYMAVHDGLPLDPVNNNQPLEQAGILRHNASRFIFTPHGRVLDCSTIILTREDYRNLKYTLVSTLTTLRHLLISRPVIYLGYGLGDPDFFMIKDEIAAIYQGGEREHFAIMPDVSDLQKRFWREQYGITILSYDREKVEVKQADGVKHVRVSHAELLRLLKELHQIVKEKPASEVGVETIGKLGVGFVFGMVSSLLRYLDDIIHTYADRRLTWFPIEAYFRKDFLPPSQTSGSQKGVPPSFRTMYIPIFQLLDKSSSLILIGAPGTGKTYAVTAYAGILAERTASKLRATSKIEDKDILGSIPLILPMKEYTGEIKAMIASRLPRSLDVDSALEIGCFLLVFDGINEVPRNFVETKVLNDDILWLINRFPRNRFIFTCRSMNYVPFLPLPVYELKPVSLTTVDQYVSDNCGIPAGTLPEKLKTTLTNPLMLSLFMQTREVNQEKIGKATSLLAAYLSLAESKLVAEIGTLYLPLTRLLGPIAYRMVDEGSQTLPPEEFLAQFYASIGADFVNSVFQILMSLGLIVPNTEGRIAFFHQTLTEYLAAAELKSRYDVDPTVLEGKIDYLRWDETIMLFVSLLSQEQSKAALAAVANKDLLYACRAFESAAIHDETTGLRLFDMILERLADPLTSFSEKRTLGSAISHLGVFGRRDVLLKLLDDKAVAEGASTALALMRAKEATPKLLELLLRDNVWPSEYAAAIRLLADESMIPELILHAKKAKKGDLLISNLADILASLESERLYSEISRLAQSGSLKERRLAARTLSRLYSDIAIEWLVKMLSDPDHEVRWEPIFAFTGTFGRPVYKTSAVVSQMFNLLDDGESGHWAAEYLVEVADIDILTESAKRLKNPRNKYEHVNLCRIIAKSDPKKAKEELFGLLDDYDPHLHNSLYHALSSLGINNIVPEIFRYLRSNNQKLRITVLEALRIPLSESEELAISEEDCELLISLWETSDDYMETHMSGYLASDHCAALSKKMLLGKLSNAGYPHRDRITELVARLPLTNGDLPETVIDWLITKLSSKSQMHPEWNPISIILGKTCDERVVIRKLLPLLKSSNAAVRSNANLAIREAERNLGKRFTRR